MRTTKFVDFDLFMNRIRVRDKDHLFQKIAKNLSPQCDSDSVQLYELLLRRVCTTSMSAEGGLVVFDLASHFIKNPVMVLATLERGIDFDAIDDKPVDIFAAVLSPVKNVSVHLQCLSTITRLFRSKDLQGALRCAHSLDEMKVLFMPTQDWIIAA